MNTDIFQVLDKEYLDTPDGRIYYYVSNRGFDQTLVFLHGLTADHTLFEKQIPYFLNNYNIICWDAPAHGLSRPFENFNYHDIAGYLKEILDKENVSNAVLIGQSMGGFVSQMFIHRYPESVDGFIAIDTCPFGTKYYPKSDQFWLRQADWMAKRFPEQGLREGIAKISTYTKESYENFLKALQGYSKDELCYLMKVGFGGFLDENCDVSITCPTLILLGQHDKTGKVEKYSKVWADRTSFPLVIVPDAAHNSNYDNYEFVNREITDFLESF